MRAGSFLLAAVLLSAPAAQAAPFSVFSEDFAEEVAAIAPSITAGNFAGLDSFTIVNGSVDLFANGGFGLSCPSTGCLDLDGSTGDAVRMETAALNFSAGVNYVLSFNISGNQRGGASDSLTVGIDNGVLGSQVFLRNPSDPFGVVTLPFTVAANTTGALFFDHAGGDNFGIILDRVDITGDAAVIPIPAALPLLVSGLAGLGLFRRRARG